MCSCSIFVSHRFDGEAALKDLLLEYPNGTNLAYDPEITPSQLSDKLFNAFRSAEAFIQVHRLGGMQSEFTHLEWKIAEKLGLPITTVVIRGKSDPVRYSKFQYGQKGYVQREAYSKAELHAEIIFQRMRRVNLTAQEAFEEIRRIRTHQGKSIDVPAFSEWR